MKPAAASLPSDTEVLVKRSFDAPVKLVWRAYMEPDLMRRWCGGLPGSGRVTISETSRSNRWA